MITLLVFVLQFQKVLFHQLHVGQVFLSNVISHSIVILSVRYKWSQYYGWKEMMDFGIGVVSSRLRHFCLATQSAYPALPGTNWYYPVLPGITRYYPVLPGITRYYPVLPGITRYYPALPGIGPGSASHSTFNLAH